MEVRALFCTGAALEESNSIDDENMISHLLPDWGTLFCFKHVWLGS